MGAIPNEDGTFNRTSMESKLLLSCAGFTVSRLLIEPVWNRNMISLIIYGQSPPFNRTSMESKQNTVSSFSNIAFLLLIEPVWNRNDLNEI